MKNLLKIISLVFALILANGVFAQTSIGVKGGVNFATMSNDPFAYPGSQLDHKYMAGFDVAVFGTIKVAGVFSVQPEFHWMQKGTKSTMATSDNMDVVMTLRYNYLELPVLARFDFGTELLNVNFFVGPSVGYAANGKYIGKNIALGDETPKSGNFDQDLEWDKEYGVDGMKDNRWDVSGVAGVGVGYDIGGVVLLMDLRYNLDFTDAVNYENKPDPKPDTFYNRGVSVTAGVSFPIGF